MTSKQLFPNLKTFFTIPAEIPQNAEQSNENTSLGVLLIY
jgi:hypothetical protein